MKNGKHRELTVGSLYAGIGGICRAFQKAGAKLLWANEFDPHAQLTYKRNFQHTLLTKDISYYEERLGQLVSENAPLEERILRPDILTSGFPCQAFSIAGKRLGFEDLRGLHFFKTMSFLKKLEPSAYLFENVKNLQSHNSGDTIYTIKKTIHDAGYSYVVRVLNSMHYGNIPQNRERVFIIGFQGEAHYNNLEQGKKASDLGSPKTTLFLKHFPKPKHLRKKIKSLLSKRVDKKYYYSDFECYKTLRKFVNKRDTVYQWRRVYARENKSNVCPTLTANMGTGGHNVPIVLDSKGIRKLTPRECARFQGFEDNELKFPKKMANCHLYKQLGNSVTVKVVERLARAVISSLKQ